MIQKEATLEAKEELVDLIATAKTTIKLQNGRSVSIGYIRGDTQDRIDYLIVKYETFKKKLNLDSEKDINKGNKYTRQFYAKCAAAILLNSPILNGLFWWLKWRWIYYFGNYTGNDYLNIIVEAKKKAQEQEYSVAMALLMDMTTTWTVMTKKEAEEYRHELELAREAQSLRNSQR